MLCVYVQVSTGSGTSKSALLDGSHEALKFAMDQWHEIMLTEDEVVPSFAKGRTFVGSQSTQGGLMEKITLATQRAELAKNLEVMERHRRRQDRDRKAAKYEEDLIKRGQVREAAVAAQAATAMARTDALYAKAQLQEEDRQESGAGLKEVGLTIYGFAAIDFSKALNTTLTDPLLAGFEKAGMILFDIRNVENDDFALSSYLEYFA